MMKNQQPNYPAAILASFNSDVRGAYDHLAKEYLALQSQYYTVTASRFLEISRFKAESEICLRQVTEQHISRAVDMADCDVDYVLRKWLYLDDDGTLYPVTIGKQERINRDEDAPFYFAASAMVANGKQVGDVVYTDH